MLDFLWNLGDWFMYEVLKPTFGKYWCEIVFLIVFAIFVIIFTLMVVFMVKFSKMKKRYKLTNIERDTQQAYADARKKLLDDKQDEVVKLKAQINTLSLSNNDLNTKIIKTEKTLAKLEDQHAKIKVEYEQMSSKCTLLEADVEEKTKLIASLEKKVVKAEKKTDTTEKKTIRKKKTILVEDK